MADDLKQQFKACYLEFYNSEQAWEASKTNASQAQAQWDQIKNASASFQGFARGAYEATSKRCDQAIADEKAAKQRYDDASKALTAARQAYGQALGSDPPYPFSTKNPNDDTF